MTATLFELFDEQPGGPLLVHDYKWASASSWKGKLWDALNRSVDKESAAAPLIGASRLDRLVV